MWYSVNWMNSDDWSKLIWINEKQSNCQTQTSPHKTQHLICTNQLSLPTSTIEFSADKLAFNHCIVKLLLLAHIQRNPYIAHIVRVREWSWSLVLSSECSELWKMKYKTEGFWFNFCLTFLSFFVLWSGDVSAGLVGGLGYISENRIHENLGTIQLS